MLTIEKIVVRSEDNCKAFHHYVFLYEREVMLWCGTLYHSENICEASHQYEVFCVPQDVIYTKFCSHMMNICEASTRHAIFDVLSMNSTNGSSCHTGYKCMASHHYALEGASLI